MSQFQTPANWNVTSVSPILRVNPHDKFAFVTTHDSTVVRNSITALFVALNSLLALAGAAYIRTRARSRVARNKSVSVKHLTSWLALGDVATYTWSLHSLPGGWLGVLMVFTGLVNVLHQFATNTLVTPTRVPSRCVFDYGTVWNKTIWSSAPGPNDEPANLVYQAQLATLSNEGTRGIYHKFLAANEIQMFRPEAQDTHGAWNCANVRNDTVPWTGPKVSEEDIANSPSLAGIEPTAFSLYINKTAYMDRTGMWYQEWATTADGSLVNAFMIWSAVNQSQFTNLKAAILNGASLVDGPPHALDFDCSLTLDGPAPYIDISTVLPLWINKAYGFQETLNTVKDSKLWLELTLDAITTLALYNDRIYPENIVPKSNIGCVVEGTRVSGGIVTILGTVFLLLIALLTAQSFILLRDLRHYSKKPGNLLPFDLADWQLAAYRQCKGERAPTFNDLRHSVCRHDAAEDGLWMEMRLADRSGQYQVPDQRLSTLPNKFEWKDHGNVEYDPGRTESFSNKPWVDVIERTLSKSDRRRSSVASPYSSIAGSYDSQYADNRWLLDR